MKSDGTLERLLASHRYREAGSSFGLPQLAAGRNRASLGDYLGPRFLDHTEFYYRNWRPSLIVTQPYGHLDFTFHHRLLTDMGLGLLDLGLQAPHNPGCCVLMAICRLADVPPGCELVRDIDCHVEDQLTYKDS